MSLIEPRQVRLREGAVVTLRSACPQDAAAVLAYRKMVLGETEFLASDAADMRDGLDEQVNAIRKAAEQTASLYLLALVNGELIGLLNFSGDQRRKLRHRGSFGMTVLRQHWGRGIGSALVETLLAWAASHDTIEKVCLSVYAGNDRGIALYRKFGFIEEGRLRRSFRLGADRYDDEIVMARFVKDAAGGCVDG